ncbi:MAG: hisA/hisF family protein [Pirellula sp.]|nr:hisA/hisF family protein [Pirellula sp.]
MRNVTLSGCSAAATSELSRTVARKSRQYEIESKRGIEKSSEMVVGANDERRESGQVNSDYSLAAERTASNQMPRASGILPVLDLQRELVVRGVAGDRENYRPIHSRWCEGAKVAGVARGLREAFHFDTCYLADLDAIAGAEPSWQLYEETIAAGLAPWIDAGTTSVDRAGRIAEFIASRSPQSRVIVGLESVPDVATLAGIGRRIGWQRLVFSLDLKQGVPLAPSFGWAGQTPEQIAETAVTIGVQTLIVLDLAAVGGGEGVPTLELCRRLHAKYPTLRLLTGGGVRDLADVRQVHESGCAAALVASALHDGRIQPAMLKPANH